MSETEKNFARPRPASRRTRNEQRTRTQSISGSGSHRTADTYSAAVRWLRIGLPLAALCITIGIFLTSRGGGDPAEALFLRSGDALKLGAGMRLTKPSFSGATSTGEPFVVRADWAQPDGPNPSLVEMKGIAGEFFLDNGDRVEAVAGTGMVEMATKTIALNDGIRLVSDSGYTLTAPTGVIDTKNKKMSMANGVSGYGPLGRFTANVAELDHFTEQEKMVGRFSGGVEVRIDKLPDPAPGEDGSASPTDF